MHHVCVEVSSLSSIAPNIQEAARAQQAGEQRLFEAGLFDTAPFYSDAANGSGAGSGSGTEQDSTTILLFSKDRFERLKQDYAKAKGKKRDRIIFDGCDLHVEYAQRMIDQLFNNFEKADPSSLPVFYHGADLSPQVEEASELASKMSESTNEEVDNIESGQIEESTKDEPLLAYMSFERLMLHGKHSEAMLPNVRQHMNAALQHIEQSQAESKQDYLYEVLKCALHALAFTCAGARLLR